MSARSVLTSLAVIGLGFLFPFSAFGQCSSQGKSGGGRTSFSGGGGAGGGRMQFGGGGSGGFGGGGRMQFGGGGPGMSTTLHRGGHQTTMISGGRSPGRPQMGGQQLQTQLLYQQQMQTQLLYQQQQIALQNQLLYQQQQQQLALQNLIAQMATQTPTALQQALESSNAQVRYAASLEFARRQQQWLPPSTE